MRHQRGFILPMVIFSLAIMGVLVLVMVGTSDDDRTGSRYDFEGTRSFYAAEAGMDTIMTSWKASGYEATVPNVGDTNGLGWKNLPGNGGSYHGVIQKVAASTYVVTVDGRTPGARKGLRTVQMMLTPGAGPFNWALLGGSSVTVSGGTIDSWDSRVGNYAASNCATLGVTCDGDIQSNGNISLSGGAHIEGDANAVGTISGCAGRVDGTCTPGVAAVTMGPVSCDGDIQSNGNISLSGGAHIEGDANAVGTISGC